MLYQASISRSYPVITTTPHPNNFEATKMPRDKSIGYPIAGATHIIVPGIDGLQPISTARHFMAQAFPCFDPTSKSLLQMVRNEETGEDELCLSVLPHAGKLFPNSEETAGAQVSGGDESGQIDALAAQADVDYPGFAKEDWEQCVEAFGERQEDGSEEAKQVKENSEEAKAVEEGSEKKKS